MRRILLLVGVLAFAVPMLRGAPEQIVDDGLSGQLGDGLHTAEKMDKNLVDNKKVHDAALTSPTPANQKAATESDATTNQFATVAVKKFPDDSGVQKMGAITSAQLGDMKTAQARADKAVELTQRDLNTPGQTPEQRTKDVVDALTVRAAIRAQEGDKQGALDDVDKALKISPDDEIAGRLSKLIAGHDLGKIGVSLTPGQAKSDKDVMLARGALGQINDAIVKRVVNRPAGFASSVGHTKEAESGLQMGDYQKMYDEASAAIEKLPDNPKAYMQRAFASLMMKKYDQVVKDSTEGLKKKPGSASLLGLRAAAYNETGRPKDALEDSARAIEDNPKDPFAWLQKGLAREKLNEGNDEYLGDIKQSAELNPEFEHYYTEALARRGQGNAAPAAASGGNLFQRWILPVATVSLCVLLVIVSFASKIPFSKKKREPVPPAGMKEGPEGKLLAGQYRIVRELGRGGMGIVYEAFDTTLERPVALKRISEDLKANPEEAGRLLKEAKTVAALRHDNIVVIHNAFQDDGDVYCVFEKVTGETLGDFIENRRRLEPVEATAHIAALASALDYAHKLKIIHRDLKPANIMLEGGKVKIMDFGIARRMRSGKGVTLTEMVIGTPAYMAPELHFGEVSPESDLYALGVVTYQMLTGRLPFEGEGIQQDKFDGKFPPASTWVKAPGIDAFFKKALAPDRKDRFHSGAELVDAYRKAQT